MFRRDFLSSSTAMAVLFAAGCSKEKPIQNNDLPAKSIDMHTHIFNARDIPLTGFLTQVALRPADEPAGNSPYKGLVNLLVKIMYSRTKLAATELDEIQQNQFSAYELAEADLLKKDEVTLTKGIADFEKEVLSQSNLSRAALDTDYLANRKMLDQLYAIAGVNVSRLAPSPQQQNAPAAIAAQIYRPRNQMLRMLSVSNSSLIQVLRWAATLSRDRRGVLSQLKTLYGKQDEIKIFSPSIVDFEYWLIKIKGETFSPVADQIDVMSEIAKRESQAVLLNFVSFCPLRAAIETERGRDPLRLVKMAVSRARGFAGVKLYPPMGFLPIGNDPNATFGKRRGLKAKGDAIDYELIRLYRWCIKNEVPIKAHGNNSLGADVDDGCNASPMHWGIVLQDPDFSKLKVNIAHFGGFDETLPAQQECSADNTNGQDWEAISAALTDDLDGIYVDLGYWESVLRTKGKSYTRAVTKTRDLLRAHPNLKDRVMYGSDWSMIGRLVGHPYYHVDVQSAITDLENRTGMELMKNFMSRNSLRYLGLDHKGKQWERLSVFFGKEHLFWEIFGNLPKANSLH